MKEPNQILIRIGKTFEANASGNFAVFVVFLIICLVAFLGWSLK